MPARDRADDRPPLASVRVLDLSSGIAGAYCTKLLCDAGADVVKVEARAGDPLRRRVPDGIDLAPGEDGALFRFLHTGVRSVVLDGDADLAALASVADIVVEDGPARTDFQTAPDTVRITMSAFGSGSPWADRATSDLTLQAFSSSISGRGERNRAPVAAGAELIDYATGATAAVAAMVALRRRQRTGAGDGIDVSKLEAAVLIFNGFRAVSGQFVALPPGPRRVVEVPSIEPARDGWVGFCTLTSSQFGAFAEMIGAPEWAGDPEIQRIDVRCERADELRPRIAAWTEQHTVAEIVAEASARRIPCAPVGNGATIPTISHFAERGVLVPHPGADFVQPRVPYRYSRTPQPALRPSPSLGSTTATDVLRSWPHRPPPPAGSGAAQSPLAGIRVFDLTSFWAGSYASQILGAFGADVIKVESIQRPDGTRLGTSYGVAGERAWERAPLFQGVNTGKRDVTLDLTTRRGQELGRRLLAECDVLIENYVPRVLDRFGLLDDTRDDLIVVRMPAWGLSGPWRDLPGFAQTMEQATGLAWVTGHRDGCPLLPRGPCDPIGGLHGAVAVIGAILDRDRTGRGQLIEAPLTEPALNVAAEQIVSYSAYGALLERNGNASRWDAPCGVYRCRVDETWVAVSVEGDEQWAALTGALGSPNWTVAPAFASAAGRRAHRDELDTHLATWCASRTPDEVTAQLWPAGVPAAPVVLPERVLEVAPLLARRFFETVDHPVLGPIAVPGFAARFESRRKPFHRAPAPLLGQHNAEVLGGLLGLSDPELDELEADAVIGTRPADERR